MTFSNTSSTSVEEEVVTDYCESMPGLQPHNYQPVIDLARGSGVYLYCNQCGDAMLIDGTGPDPNAAPAQPAATPSAGSNSPSASPSTGRPFP